LFTTTTKRHKQNYVHIHMRITRRYSHIAVFTIPLLIFQHLFWSPYHAFVVLERYDARRSTILTRKRAKEHWIPTGPFDKVETSWLRRLSTISGVSSSETTTTPTVGTTTSELSTLPAANDVQYKVGVLFLNLGGPTTGEDVEGNSFYIQQYFMGI
jgi:hypothetical protein